MDLHTAAERLSRLMEERLDIGGEGLAAKYRRAGRRVPRWVKREIAALLEALELAENPRTLPRVDMVRIETGVARAESWLKSVDPWDRRKGIVLSWLAVNAMNLILVLALALGVMAWRGLL